MNATEIYTEREAMIAELLKIDNLDLMKKLKSVFARTIEAFEVSGVAQSETQVAEDEGRYMSKAELIDGLEESLREVKAMEDGKMERMGAMEFLETLR